MQIITLNNSHYDVRKEKINGVNYVIAPITFIVQGVLPGNKGPLYYPSEEIIRNHSQWDGIPLTLRHPFINGKWVSAKNPKVLSSQGVGALKFPKVIVENGLTKLRGLGYFVLDALKRLHPETLKKIESGKKIEVSTGLFTTNYEVKPSYFKGKFYEKVARNYQADHIAILPDETGACSIQDGCGVLNMKSITINCSCGGYCKPCKKKLKEQKMTKEDLVKKVSNNCEIPEESLQGLTENQLQTLITNHEVSQAAKTGFKDGDKLYWFDTDRNRFVRNESEEDMKDEDEENEEDEDMEDEDETDNKKSTKNKKKPTKNCEDDEEDEPTDNIGKTEYWIEKAQIISNLTNNLSGKEKSNMVKNLSKKSLSDLRDIDTLTSNKERKKPVYNANPGGSYNGNPDKGDPLELPEIDWNE